MNPQLESSVFQRSGSRNQKQIYKQLRIIFLNIAQVCISGREFSSSSTSQNCWCTEERQHVCDSQMNEGNKVVLIQKIGLHCINRNSAALSCLSGLLGHKDCIEYRSHNLNFLLSRNQRTRSWQAWNCRAEKQNVFMLLHVSPCSTLNIRIHAATWWQLVYFYREQASLERNEYCEASEKKLLSEHYEAVWSKKLEQQCWEK